MSPADEQALRTAVEALQEHGGRAEVAIPATGYFQREPAWHVLVRAVNLLRRERDEARALLRKLDPSP